LQKAWADGTYQGQQEQRVASESGITLEVVKRSDNDGGFVVQARRWIVERTFGWLIGSSFWPRTTTARRSPQKHSSIWA